VDKIIPIGKHKGKSIEEVRLIEPQYLDWLAAQDWFNKKYADLIEAIRGGGQPSFTPEHNALQARFLDPQFAVAATAVCWRDSFYKSICDSRIDDVYRDHFYNKVYDTAPYTHRNAVMTWRKDEMNSREAFLAGSFEKQDDEAGPGTTWEAVAEITNVTFEQVTDVVVTLPFFHSLLGIEVKPSVGDDYPAIIRQIKAAKKNLNFILLFYDKYTGAGVDEATMRKIVRASGIPTATLAETLAAMKKMFAVVTFEELEALRQELPVVELPLEDRDA